MRARRGWASAPRFVSRSGTTAARSRSLRAPSGSPALSAVMPRGVPASITLCTNTRSPVSHAVTSRVSNASRRAAGWAPIFVSTSVADGKRSCMRQEPERRSTRLPSAAGSRLQLQGASGIRSLNYHAVSVRYAGGQMAQFGGGRDLWRGHRRVAAPITFARRGVQARGCRRAAAPDLPRPSAGATELCPCPRRPGRSHESKHRPPRELPAKSACLSPQPPRLPSPPPSDRVRAVRAGARGSGRSRAAPPPASKAASDYHPRPKGHSTLRGTDVIPSLGDQRSIPGSLQTPWPAVRPPLRWFAASARHVPLERAARTASGCQAGWRDRDRRGACGVTVRVLPHADDRDGARRRGRWAVLEGRPDGCSASTCRSSARFTRRSPSTTRWAPCPAARR